MIVRVLHDNVQGMNIVSATTASLLPLFRSDAQFHLVGVLFTSPGREFTVGELAEAAGVSHPTVSRETARLRRAGLVNVRHDGNKTLVSANRDSSVFSDLRNLMAKVHGAPAVLAEEFAGMPVHVYIFGSWAARWAGEPGPPPNDIDVLVVGEVDPRDVWEAAARAGRRLGLEVSPVMRSAEEWEADTGGFAEQVRRRPIIEVAVSRGAPRGAAPLASGETRWG